MGGMMGGGSAGLGTLLGITQAGNAQQTALQGAMLQQQYQQQAQNTVVQMASNQQMSQQQIISTLNSMVQGKYSLEQKTATGYFQTYMSAASNWMGALSGQQGG
jgi:hypothetical protein